MAKQFRCDRLCGKVYCLGGWPGFLGFRYRQSNGKPWAWSSQHLHLKKVRQFFAWLTKQNYIPFNPAAELELPKLHRQLPKAILSEDDDHFLVVPQLISSGNIQG